ncbi:MAG: flagellin FliC [Planctomycetes bacterium]|nr:flagellin FliC [Planctomycetota bacterium]
MSLRINTNISSMQAQRDLRTVTNRLSRNFARLSSGLRIASAADDASGLIMSERMRARIRSMNTAVRNANDGVSLVQTGEGALNEVSNMLVRLRELAVQSSNGTLSTSERNVLNQEFQSLITEIDRAARAADFNGKALFDGTTSAITLQIGVGTSNTVDRVAISLTTITSSSLSLSGLAINGTAIDQAITTVDAAIDTVNSLRGTFGATQNRLESTIASLQIALENLSSAESRIRDVDVAAETADLTRNSIIQQAAASVLAQANLQPQIALTLLG